MGSRAAPSGFLRRFLWGPLDVFARRISGEVRGWEHLFRLQVQILYVLIFFWFNVMWIGLQVYYGNLTNAIVFFGGLVVLIGLAWLSIKLRRLELFGHLTLILLLGMISVSTYLTGGLRTTNVCAFIFVMVTSPCVLGKQGFIWSAGALLVAVGFQLAEWNGVVFSDLSDPDSIETDTFITWFSSAVGVFLALLAYEGTLAAVTRKLRESELALADSTRQLYESQKLETIGRLAGGVAHDFNNLLVTINGCAELAGQDLGEDHPCHEDVTDILDAGRRAARLTRQLLAFSRRQVLKRSPVDLSELVESLSAFLRRITSERIEMVTDLEPNLAPASLDPAQIEQVVMNLAINATEAMPDGGVLRIETANGTHAIAGGESVLAGEPEEVVILRVSDTGIGMRDGVVDDIFEPFFSTKERGTGLGLAVVDGIVRQHMGRVEVTSAEGSGTTFTVYLPTAVKQEPVVTYAEPGAAMPAGEGRRILLVEDDGRVAKYARRLLERSGFEVVAAGSAEQALTILGDSERAPDLVLTDMVLPGMSGMELVAEVRQQWPEVGVLLTSGYSDSLVGDAGLAGAPPRFIAKPYSTSELLAEIGAALAERPPAEAEE